MILLSFFFHFFLFSGYPFILNIRLIVSGLDENLEKLRSFTTQADQLIQDTMVESAQKNIAAVARSLAPKRTGALSGSIDVRPGSSPTTIELIADKFYAKFLEYGTRPHMIEPSNAKALHFEVHGHDVFAKHAYNPGIPSGKFSFMMPAIDQGIPQLLEDIQSMFNERLNSS